MQKLFLSEVHIRLEKEFYSVGKHKDYRSPAVETRKEDEAMLHF